MAIERTISIVKPDAVAKNIIGQIYSRFEQNGLRIVAAKMKHLSVREAQDFYAVHKERPFYADTYKTSFEIDSFSFLSIISLILMFIFSILLSLKRLALMRFVVCFLFQNCS